MSPNLGDSEYRAAEIIEATKPKHSKTSPGMRYQYHRVPDPKPWEKLTLKIPGGLTVRDAIAGKHRSLRLTPLYTVTKPVTAYSHLSPTGLATAGWQYLFGRQGVLSRGLFPTSGFFYAETGRDDAEIQVSIAPALVERRRPGLLGILPTEHGFTLLLNHGSPFSRGQVRLKSADAREIGRAHV